MGHCGLHGEAGGDGDDQRGDDGDDAQKLRYGQLDGPAAEKDRMRVGQIGGVAVAEREERAEENEESERRKGREGSPLEAPGLPEDARVAERAEPQKINPVGDRGAAADEDEDDDGEEEVNGKARAARLLRASANRWFRAFLTPLRRFVRAEIRKNCTAVERACLRYQISSECAP